MKTITMDWQTYQEENAVMKRLAFKEGVREAKRLFLELLAGADIENLSVEFHENEALLRLAKTILEHPKFTR